MPRLEDLLHHHLGAVAGNLRIGDLPDVPDERALGMHHQVTGRHEAAVAGDLLFLEAEQRRIHGLDVAAVEDVEPRAAGCGGCLRAARADGGRDQQRGQWLDFHW